MPSPLRTLAETGQDEAYVKRIHKPIAIHVGGVAVGITGAYGAPEAGEDVGSR